MYIFHVTYHYCQILHKFEFFRQIFGKKPPQISKFMKNTVGVELFHVDGQTYRHYQTHTFHNSTKKPNKKKAYWNASADFLLRRDERSLRRTTQCKKLATGAPNDAAHRFHHGVLYFLTIVQSNSTNVN